MRNRIILYHPKTSHEKNYKFFWIPYSVLSVAAPLVENGYNVQIIDGNLEEDIDVDLTDVLFVAVSSMIGHQIEDGLNFCSKVRQKSEVPILWGGPLPTLLPEITLKSSYIDFIIRGPGDKLILSFAESLRMNTRLPQGIGYRKDKEIFLGEIQKLPNRNNLPNYPFQLLDLDKYVRDDPNICNNVINYISSQGCPFGCGFCTEVAIYKGQWSSYSASRTLDEVCKLVDMTSVEGIKFYDANFFANPKRAVEFAEGLIKRKPSLKWAASAHPKNLLALKDSDFEILKKSGLTRLLVGFESGVQNELEFVNKHLTLEETVVVANKLEKYGIIGSFTFITGYPSMPEENILKTIEFATKLANDTNNHEFKMHLFLPFPGTPLYDLAISKGFRPPSNLQEWSTLDYYEIMTPWVDPKYNDVVQKFNAKYCPYVSL